MKKSSSAEKKEIEHLLGEDFETIAEARAALKRESSPVVSARMRNKSSYSLRELPSVKGKTVTGILESIEKNRETVDALRKPGELWAAEFETKFGNHKIYRAFEDIDLLAQYLSRYESIKTFGDKVGANNTSLIKSIKLIKFKGTAKQYFDEKQTAVKEYAAKVKSAQEHARTVSKKYRKLVSKSAKESKKSQAIARKLLKEEMKVSKMKAQVAQMEQRIRELKAGKDVKKKVRKAAKAADKKKTAKKSRAKTKKKR